MDYDDADAQLLKFLHLKGECNPQSCPDCAVIKRQVREDRRAGISPVRVIEAGWFDPNGNNL